MHPEMDLAAARNAHDRLLATVQTMTDLEAESPSQLSGWSRAHVLTHLARNADSHRWLIEGAIVGQVRTQYPTPGMREADIAAGGRRAIDELREDLNNACARLEAAWDAVPHDVWDCECVLGVGARPLHELPFRRLREVEVHHTDLDLTYSASDWPDEYVAGELQRRLPGLPDRCDQRALTAWLLQRGPAPELGAW